MPYPCSGGLAAVLVISVGTILFLGSNFLFEWYTQRSDEEHAAEAETGYYRLPPPEERAAACAKAMEEDLVEQRVEFDRSLKRRDAYTNSRGSRRGMCVCCFERPQRYMFVLCRHICLCEPCLIQAARTHEETVLLGEFDGPVKMPCLVCRRVGYVVKTFAS
ncbi:hypothetical protein LSCM4_06591 [Leishmania orientalis]|uniref:RING-type domain-containing protein n=1 Tax=Leishmania orientalis TaxID=2249476 RepID=A0A836HZC8_9TRYP|nr:hypothetical protein LSCM4_06591 [Leishmania orientalis]